MHHWTRRLFAIAAPLLLTSCLWSPGKFASDLTLRKDGSFILDYRGEIELQLPPDASASEPWSNSMAHCYASSHGRNAPPVEEVGNTPPERTCTPAEIAQQKAAHAQTLEAKRRQNEEMAKAFGLPGTDEASNRAFAVRLMKYAGWRSVAYRGNGVFDVDYHMAGRLTQDFVFPLMPDNNIVVPFIALRRRADGAVLVNAPALTGGMNMFGPLAQQMGGDTKASPPSRAEGRFTIHTDGQIVTNNSEDGPAADPIGQQLHWDVAPDMNKVPETLIRL